MTKEAYLRASKIVNDIDTLEEVQFTIRNEHLVEFVIESAKILPIESKILQRDFKKFVNTEIEKLKDELEKL